MGRSFTIFYASDIHGSERVFRKFLNAAPFYKADALIFGGDLTGKALIPLVEVAPGSFRTTYFGPEQLVDLGSSLEELETAIRARGSYPYRTTPEEYAAMQADPALVTRIFSHEMHRTAERWVTLADERLRAAGIPAVMMPGNDDEPEVKEILAQGDWIVDGEGRVVQLGDYQVVSYGYATTTPWHSPREVTEEMMGEALTELTGHVDPTRPVIFNFHDPPRDSGLDMAFKIDAEKRVDMKGGQAQLVAVGSTSVRSVIERIQPVLSLHGHIHESRAVAKVGRTPVINPGSSYTDGTLQGVLIRLDGRKVTAQQLVSG
jgi:uncharacterized protein